MRYLLSYFKQHFFYFYLWKRYSPELKKYKTAKRLILLFILVV